MSNVEELVQKLEVADAALNGSFLAIVSERVGTPFAKAIVNLKARSQEAAVLLTSLSSDVSRLTAERDRYREALDKAYSELVQTKKESWRMGWVGVEHLNKTLNILSAAALSEPTTYREAGP